jgi:hypothetical protein
MNLYAVLVGVRYVQMPVACKRIFENTERGIKSVMPSAVA